MVGWRKAGAAGGRARDYWDWAKCGKRSVRVVSGGSGILVLHGGTGVTGGTGDGDWTDWGVARLGS